MSEVKDIKKQIKEARKNISHIQGVGAHKWEQTMETLIELNKGDDKTNLQIYQNLLNKKQKLENEKGQKKYKKAVKKWGKDLKYTRPVQPKKYGGKISPRKANYS